MTLITSEQAHEFGRIVSDFEKHFREVWLYDGRHPAHISPTGEEYRCYSAHGERGEGEASSASVTADDALKSLDLVLRSLVPATPSSLYWRTKPEIAFVRKVSSYCDEGWFIYSRFLISDKPAKDAEGITQC